MSPYIAAPWILWVIGGFSIVTVVTTGGFFSQLMPYAKDERTAYGNLAQHVAMVVPKHVGRMAHLGSPVNTWMIRTYPIIPPFPSSNQFIYRFKYLYPESIRIIIIVQPQSQDRNLNFQLPGFRDCPPSFAYSNIPLDNHCDNIIILPIVIIMILIPICSMYGTFTNICPKNDPNVETYTIHGAYGIVNNHMIIME